VLDLKTPAGRAAVKALAAQADVVVENFRPGLAEKLGLGYDELKAINPALIYCSITGFGRTGPDRDRPALDQVVQAVSGLMQITGTEESGPLKTGFPFSDLVTALLATIGIQHAVIARGTSGVGQRVDLSMLDASVFSLVPRDIYYDVMKKTPPRMGNAHWDIVPNNVYRTSDGRDIMVITINDKFWKVLATGLGVADMVDDPLYSTKTARLQNRDRLEQRLRDAFASRTLAEWEQRLSAAGAIYGAVRTWDEVFNDPQVVASMIHDVDHAKAGTLRMVGNPLKFSGTPVTIRLAPPQLGEHSASVLSAPEAAWQQR
jgi:crotonobetainyl-CoA:carnitine CoA-transferase CaiB-like acyl-CoA transferase